MTTEVASTDNPASLPSPWDIRDEFQHLVISDLLGPVFGEEEILPQFATPRDWYLVGALAPYDTVAVDPERQDDLGIGGDEDSGEAVRDDENSATVKLFPSSFGMTFTVEDSVESLDVDVSWGRYLKEDIEPEETRESDGGPRWRRHPVVGATTVALSEGTLDVGSPVPDQSGVVVEGRCRRVHNHWLVTLFLVNKQEPGKRNRDEAWLFQAAMGVSTPNGSPVFVGREEALPRSRVVPNEEQFEVAQLDMLYRDDVEFAAGHGTAVHAVVQPGNPARAVRIETQTVPIYEIPSTGVPGPDDGVEYAGLADVVFDMKVLSESTEAGLVATLQNLVDAYRRWIDVQTGRLPDPEARLDKHRETALEALDVAGETADRLQAGVDLLAGRYPRDDARELALQAFEAFRFANEAMWQQRVHSIASMSRRTDESLSLDEAVVAADIPINRSWRPFQLAFILLNLPSLTNPMNDERGKPGLADLLFFPTGGGKTEAYLGLTAFTLAIRRLQGMVAGRSGAGGVAVLMRYTLRLLTAQQFQRAAALMSACELIRKSRLSEGDSRWFGDPFRLGMWVGSGVTPNRSKDAAWVVEQARRTGRKGAGSASPLQLTNCPWCGERLDLYKAVRADEVLWRTFTYCTDPRGDCPFTEARSIDPETGISEGIPVVTVDDEIYRLLPSFIIATADKFAQLPWQGPLHLLFGKVDKRCERHGYRSSDLDELPGRTEPNSTHPATTRGRRLPRHNAAVAIDPLRPPDLIIQDELHLISGPLGTLVGLYETAIDSLATWDVDDHKVRPKVVASTATVRRAAEQTYKLFWRKLAVFPPPVLDIGGNFFSLQREPTPGDPGRRYVGLCAHGHRLKSVETRVYVACLAASQMLFEKYGEAADPHMTLVGYFGSLRELGGMRRLVDDDVRNRLRRTDRRGLAKRNRPFVRELTSRISSTNIPQVLDQLGVKHVPDADSDADAIDVLLATNMISVGVDVPRLGLMVVAGQPKTTAEYIQATSRIGRDASAPGIVFTLYNWARPRDLSHYETFEQYHATFYRHVEALSVTPFAARALDRGLTAVLVAMARQGHTGWSANGAAQDVDTHDAYFDGVLDAVAERAAAVHSDALIEAEVRAQLQHRLDVWAQKQNKPAVVLGYKARQAATIPLLELPTGGPWTEWTCPNSLRETEAPVNFIIDAADPSIEAAPAFQLGTGARRDVPPVRTIEDDETDGE